MVLRKQELKKFLIWMRNGISFAVTWFLILLLVGSYGLNIPQIAVTTLIKMVVLTAGGALLFCICFTKLILVRWSFIKRLSFFVVLLSAYQVVGFYWIGFFANSGSVLQWVIYAAIIIVLYFCCLLICYACYRKEGKAYTQALSEYQKRRKEHHGE